MGSSPIKLLVSFVEGLRNEQLRIGWLFHEYWRHAKANVHLSDVVLAVLYVASNNIHLQNCIGARLGHGMAILFPMEEVGDTVLVWWRQGRPQTVWHADVWSSSSPVA